MKLKLIQDVAKDTGLPEEVHVYHSLYKIEDSPGKILGHSSWVYKAVCRSNGKHYIMVRIEGKSIRLFSTTKY
jgi:PAB-dependent poly(A)-specific ribonuclease subunit 3